jgi:hypothetical protein
VEVRSFTLWQSETTFTPRSRHARALLAPFSQICVVFATLWQHSAVAYFPFPSMWFIRLSGAGWACGPDLRGNLGLMGLGSGSHCLLSAGRSIWLPMRRGTIAAAPIEIKRLGQTIKKELGARPDKNRPKDAKEINRSPLSDYPSVNVLVLTWLGCALQFRVRPRPPRCCCHLSNIYSPPNIANITTCPGLRAINPGGRASPLRMASELIADAAASCG